ncbi:MAG: glycosyltransferase [Rhodospirillaceae bacterium]
MTDLSERLPQGVYFLSPESLLTHNSGCLMEGLIDLNIPVFTNAAELTSRQASMPLKDQSLAKFHSELHPNFSAYIVDISHTNTFRPLVGLEDKPVAYLSTNDSSIFCRVPEAHVLFSTHENRFAKKGGARHPIAFGPSNWLISQTENQSGFASRDGRILRNFQPTLSQGVRAMLDLSYVPLLEKETPVDRTSHSPHNYLNALGTSSACLSYGGDFYAPIMHSEWFRKHQNEAHTLHTFDFIDRESLVLRWDSWRFWESLLSGCVAIHLDFEKYGFDLPVLPEAWVHYVPIDLENIKESVKTFFDRRSEWASISERGRAWAIKHYAPKVTAERCLNIILEHQS